MRAQTGKYRENETPDGKMRRENAGKVPGKAGKTGKSGCRETGKTGKHPLGGFPLSRWTPEISRLVRSERQQIIETYAAADRANGMRRRCLLHLAAMQSQELRQVIEQERAA
jgi:hypothetical protein